MNDVGTIDRFLDVFSHYIDSGFGLLQGEVRFLTATLVAIDMTLAGLMWALGHAGGQGDDVMARLIKKVLYVGAFAYILGNFNRLAGIVFDSFAGLGLQASGSGLSKAQLLQPGRLAQVGIEAGRPIMKQIGDLTGFPEVFANLDMIVVLFLAWLVLIVAFFVLAVQLFVTLIEFKLTTLAGFVLVPFALWNKTAFLAEKVLGNVVASGVKVLVLAVIVGIGSGLFGEFTAAAGEEPSIDHALVTMLAALTLLGLGVFGPGIATGLVSGAPQLGAGTAAGTALGAAGLAVAGGAAAASIGSAAAAGARLAPGAAQTAMHGGATAGRMAASMARDAGNAYAVGAAGADEDPARAATAGMANVARAGTNALGTRLAAGTKALGERVAGFVAEAAAPPASGANAAEVRDEPSATGRAAEPAWARRMRRRQQIGHAATTAAHTLRSGDAGGAGSGPTLRDSDS
ncbi:P-type conjugative transfer protein TrbL [uncultured Pseudacidovorax sp.]|uniref:P-type conjugative transfer protein TrbL n=1 Tax=uncultured Pseudacidovorax sp. TaxID=679313 RepID=UPI0025E15C33|nr:P-type conjugative transfer protein TrbL [uncultured Pseudacidovorax sp.]